MRSREKGRGDGRNDKAGEGRASLAAGDYVGGNADPLGSPSGLADENEAAAQTQTSEIADLLAAGDYVEGEALVVVDNAVSRNSLRSRSVDPLSSPNRSWTRRPKRTPPLRASTCRWNNLFPTARFSCAAQDPA